MRLILMSVLVDAPSNTPETEPGPTDINFDDPNIVKSLTFNDLVTIYTDIFLYQSLLNSGRADPAFSAVCVKETRKVLKAAYATLQSSANVGWCREGRHSYSTLLMQYLKQAQSLYRANNYGAVIENLRRFLHYLLSITATCLCKPDGDENVRAVMNALVQAYPNVRLEIYDVIQDDIELNYPELQTLIEDFRDYYPEYIDQLVEINPSITSQICDVVADYFKGHYDYTELEFCPSLEKIART